MALRTIQHLRNHRVLSLIVSVTRPSTVQGHPSERFFNKRCPLVVRKFRSSAGHRKKKNVCFCFSNYEPRSKIPKVSIRMRKKQIALADHDSVQHTGNEFLLLFPQQLFREFARTSLGFRGGEGKKHKRLCTFWSRAEIPSAVDSSALFVLGPSKYHSRKQNTEHPRVWQTLRPWGW